MLAIWNTLENFEMEHWDIKTAFNNAEEDVYCYLPEGMCEKGFVVKLKKALYGTKQAANAWQKFLRGKFLSIGAKIHPKDECVYIFRHDEEWALVSTHVDDIFAFYDPCGKFGWTQGA